MSTEVAEELLTLLARNRRKHGKPWVKIRKSRLSSLAIPGLTDSLLRQLLVDAKLRDCWIRDRESRVLVPAVRLGEGEYLIRCSRDDRRSHAPDTRLRSWA